MTHGTDEKAFKILVEKREGKRPLGRHNRRWEDNIRKILVDGAGRCGLDASGSGYGPVAGCCEHSNEPSGYIIARNFLTS